MAMKRHGDDEYSERTPMALATTPVPRDDAKSTAASTTSTATSPAATTDVKLLCVLYAIVIMDGFSLMVAEPLMPGMFKREFDMDESVIGVAVGFMLFAFSFARMLSGFYIGHLSDKHGRRPILFMGLVVTILTLGWFTFASTYATAVIARFLGGLLNSNLGVSKAAIADVVVIPEHRSLAFGYLGALFATSRCVSTGMAGITSGVAPGGLRFFADHEHVFPCLLAVAMVTLVLLVSMAMLRETNQHMHATQKKRVPLRKSLRLIRAQPTLMRLVWMNCGQNFANGGVLLAMIIYSSLSVSHRGLGFSTTRVGVLFSIFGLVGATFQFSGYRRLIRHLSLRSCYRLGLSLLTSGCTCFALTALPRAADSAVGIDVLLGLALLLTGSGWMLGMPVLFTMSANATPADKQGVTSGVATSMGALSRAVGPLATGGAFSALVILTVPWAIFLLLGSIYVTLFFTSRGLSASVETPTTKTADSVAAEEHVDVERGDAVAVEMRVLAAGDGEGLTNPYAESASSSGDESTV